MNRAFLGNLVLLAPVVVLAGCVERSVTITSSPPGALVYLSGVEIGRTPVTRSFTWYGDYDVALRRDGYETLNTHARILPPWYEVAPLDLFSELAPWTYHDDHALNFNLVQKAPVSEAELLQRADQLRQENVLNPPKK